MKKVIPLIIGIAIISFVVGFMSKEDPERERECLWKAYDNLQKCLDAATDTSAINWCIDEHDIDVANCKERYGPQ